MDKEVLVLINMVALVTRVQIVMENLVQRLNTCARERQRSNAIRPRTVSTSYCEDREEEVCEKLTERVPVTKKNKFVTMRRKGLRIRTKKPIQTSYEVCLHKAMQTSTKDRV